MTEQATLSDYQAVGGGPAVKAVIDDFYQRVLHDPQLARYFIDVDLPRLKRHQALMITKVLGGPDGYTGRSLRDAHSNLEITAADFQRVLGHLAAALQHAGVPEDIIGRAATAVRHTKPEIVTRL
jgi:hemoglobin